MTSELRVELRESDVSSIIIVSFADKSRVIRLRKLFIMPLNFKQFGLDTADVLRCSNDGESHHATLLPIPAQGRFQIIKVCS